MKINLKRVTTQENGQSFILHNSITKIVNKIKKLDYVSHDAFSTSDYSSLHDIERVLLGQYEKENNQILIEHLIEETTFLINVLRPFESGQLVLFSAEYEGCPAAFALAFPGPQVADEPRWRHGWRLAGGRGLAIGDAVTGALGEAAECMSVWSRSEEEGLVVPDPDPRIGIVHTDANRFLQLSDRQLRRLAEKHRSSSGPLSLDKLRIANLNNRFLQFQDRIGSHAEFVPSICALVEEETWYGIDGERLTSTNGTAVAADFATASDKAMFELVERDSVAIWWYNRIPRQRLGAVLLDAAGAPELRRWLEERERRFHLLDVSSDLRVPAVAALSYRPDGGMIADGYAAGRTWPEAVLGAVLEMLQAEISLHFMAEKAARHAASGETAETSAFFAETRRMNLYEEGFMAGRDGPERTAGLDTELTAAAVRDRLAERGIDLVVADITRAELGVPAARAVSAALRDWQPRFAPGRLYDVPVAMGWLAAPNCEDTLNPRAFLT